MEDSEPLAARYVQFLNATGAITFGDFVAKSGRRTPYFVDTGRVCLGPDLQRLGSFYAEAVVARHGTAVDVVFGPAYKGIPLAVATAIAMHRDHDIAVAASSDRKEIKDHGEGGSFVGRRPRDGDRIVMIEDVTTAGTSIRATVPLLRGCAAVVLVGLVVGVDRLEHAGDPATSALVSVGRELGIDTSSIATIDDVLEHLGPDALSDSDRDRLSAYRETYGVDRSP